MKNDKIINYLLIGESYILKLVTHTNGESDFYKLIKTNPVEEITIGLGEFLNLYQTLPSKLAIQYSDNKICILDFYSNIIIDDKLNISDIDWMEHQSLGKIRFIAEI